jgi:multidrug efflux pump subunit AcrA (membrane-fusion protein)
VAASFQAPELFTIAADLTKMRVIANIDESDVGRIRPQQPVTFTVDAYPDETFTGAVSQVRLEPVVLQNVVTYATVIDAPNAELKLKPGMTATVEIEIARSDNVLRIPTSALRFTPTAEMFAALNQSVPQDLAEANRPRQQGSGLGRTTQNLRTSESSPSHQNPEARESNPTFRTKWNRSRTPTTHARAHPINVGRGTRTIFPTHAFPAQTK